MRPDLPLRLKNSGAALILVLWVLAFLTVIAAQFARTMRTEAGIAFNYREMARAHYSARAGVNMALQALLRSLRHPTAMQTRSEDPDPDAPDWRINMDIPITGPRQERIVTRIDNEGGKVNINLADQRLLRLAVSGLGLTEEEENTIVDSILDWRDSDNRPRPLGAEDDYYQALPVPHPCKNSDFDDISELLLVRGVTPEIYFAGLSERVTVHPTRDTARQALGMKPGTSQSADGFDFNRININAAAPELLMALPEFTAEMVEALVEYRLEQDLRADSDLVKLIGARAFLSVRPLITYHRSPYYTLSATAQMDQSGVRQGVAMTVRLDLQAKDQYHTVHWHPHTVVR
ncbi:general secretion pathway protein GspK [Desulfatitalea alkaliphila]|uniref:General secretion pathway protein GspK n=1 Tax=Desulfatitalea alkaliphila TaxID=2929485 RepID=A0AA41R1A2_9BACT|nr:type II secretion system protein GspK [Desulfatitalea alkaliphila]MCJ8499375.1 general secretion pathway protein GspK [Desulfatitalea alkaliphila]